MLTATALRRGTAKALCLLSLSSAAIEFARPSETCPGPETVQRDLGALDRSGTARASRFAAPLPAGLFEKAVRSPGRGFTERDGRTVHGAMLVEMPVARLWKAVNDEEHFDIDEQRYMPLVKSDVIEGLPRGERRTVFQVFRKFGISRWWTSEVVMSRELYRASGRRLWEVSWSDTMSSVDKPDPSLREITESIRPLRASYGAWLLVPIGETCTYVDYLVHADPGGLVGALQVMFAARAVRETLEGVVRLAAEHVPQGHAKGEFERPDGSLLD